MSALPDFDMSELDQKPSAAGVYDYALGGTINTAADREMAEAVRRLLPDTFLASWANRGFLQRSVKRLASELGIRQFIDLGAGFPTQGNTHEVVANATPDGRVIYVDIDPRVVHRSNQLISDVPGASAILADMRRPEDVLGHAETRRLIDFSEPVAVLAVAVTHFISDEDDPWGLVATYLDAVVPGSYLVLSAISKDHVEERWEIARATRTSDYDAYPRRLGEVERFFEGLAVIPPYPGASPKVCHVGLWGAEDPELADDEGSRLAYAGVGRKP